MYKIKADLHFKGQRRCSFVRNRRFCIISRTILLVTMYTIFYTFYVWCQEIDWTRQFGTLSNEYSQGIFVDVTGVYVVGNTDGTLPGQINAGGYDVFIRKYNLNGSEIWTRQFGTSSNDYSYGISVDETGVYISGHTDGTLSGQTSKGGYDGYIRK